MELAKMEQEEEEDELTAVSDNQLLCILEEEEGDCLVSHNLIANEQSKNIVKMYTTRRVTSKRLNGYYAFKVIITIISYHAQVSAILGNYTVQYIHAAILKTLA